MCGLIGFVGSNPNLDKLKIMSLYNDERGGDSCGFAINNEIFKYANITEDTFKKAFSKHHILKNFVIENPKKQQVVLMHTRKSSVGHAVESNAHPFLVEYDGRKLIGVHNGTIKNIADLGHKYLTEEEMKHFSHSTDSEVLFYILVKTNSYDILTEYEGGAALLWYNPDKPDILYGFKGASEPLSFGFSNIHTYGEVEERPLYLNYTPEGVYFSSLMEALNATGAESGKVLTLKSNTVYTFNKKGVEDSIVIKRVAPYYRPKPVQSLPISTMGGINKSPRLNSLLWNVDRRNELYVEDYLYKSKGEVMHGIYYITESHMYELMDYTMLELELYKDLTFMEFCDKIKKLLINWGVFDGTTDIYFFYNGYLLEYNITESYSSLLGFLFKLAKRGEKTFFNAYQNELSDYTMTPVFTTQPNKVHNGKFKGISFQYPFTSISIIIGPDNCISETRNDSIYEMYLKLKKERNVPGTSYTERLSFIDAEGEDWVEVTAITEQHGNYYAFVKSKHKTMKTDVYFRIPNEGFLVPKDSRTSPTEDEEEEEDNELFVTFNFPLEKSLIMYDIKPDEAYEVVDTLRDNKGNIITIDVQVGRDRIDYLRLGIECELVEEEEDVDSPFYSSDNPQKVEKFLRKENKKRRENEFYD